MKKMYGVITPIVTPFTKQGQVDLAATNELVDYLIEKGVHGLYPCGTTGEMLKMNSEERKLFAQAVVECADGRIPVYIQVGAATTTEAIELARHAVEIGSDGIGVVTPQFFKVSDREMEEYYVAVASSVPVDFPVYLYTIPQCAANDIKPEVVDRIVSRSPNVVGIKYSGSDFIQLKDYLLCNNGAFDVIIGPDRLVLPALAMGCVGTVSGCSQCCPEPFVETYEAFAAGDLAMARAASKRATELCEIVTSGANIAYFKAALAHNGVTTSHMRAPALDLEGEELVQLNNTLRSYKDTYGYV